MSLQVFASMFQDDIHIAWRDVVWEYRILWTFTLVQPHNSFLFSKYTLPYMDFVCIRSEFVLLFSKIEYNLNCS